MPGDPEAEAALAWLAGLWNRPDSRPMPTPVWQFALDPVGGALVRGLRNLSACRGGEAFPLGCRAAGKLLGVSHMTAWRRLKDLARAGVLKLVKKGSRKKLPGTNTMTASTWKWVGEAV